MRHLTDVERGWLLPFLGRSEEPLYATEQDPEGEFDVAGADATTDLVEDYARHNGHADLLREAIDGRTGM